VNTINKLLGANVRKHRKRLRITQEKLAEKCGKSLGTIQLMETGKVWPEISTIERLAETLGITDALLFEPDDGAAQPLEADPAPMRHLLLALASLDDDQVPDALAAIERIVAESRGLLPDDPTQEADVSTKSLRKRK